MGNISIFPPLSKNPHLYLNGQSLQHLESLQYVLFVCRSMLQYFTIRAVILISHWIISIFPHTVLSFLTVMVCIQKNGYSVIVKSLFHYPTDAVSVLFYNTAGSLFLGIRHHSNNTNRFIHTIKGKSMYKTKTVGPAVLVASELLQLLQIKYNPPYSEMDFILVASKDY